MTKILRSGAESRLRKAAEALEAELSRPHHSEPLLYKAGRELTLELNRYLNRSEAMEACGAASDSSPAARELVRECHIMIECVTLILHG